MPDLITVPSGSSGTPAEPGSLTVSGAGAVPVETAALYGDPAAIQLDLTNAVSARLRLGAAASLTDLTLFGGGAGLSFAQLVLPASVDNIVFGTGCAAGDWVDQLIAALPDRSGADDGTYTDTETILTAAQETALEAKGFSAA